MGKGFLLAEPETTTSYYNQLIVFSSNEELLPDGKGGGGDFLLAEPEPSRVWNPLLRPQRKYDVLNVLLHFAHFLHTEKY